MCADFSAPRCIGHAPFGGRRLVSGWPPPTNLWPGYLAPRHFGFLFMCGLDGSLSGGGHRLVTGRLVPTSPMGVGTRQQVPISVALNFFWWASACHRTAGARLLSLSIFGGHRLVTGRPAPAYFHAVFISSLGLMGIGPRLITGRPGSVFALVRISDLFAWKQR